MSIVVFIEEFDSIDLEHAIEHTLVDDIDRVYESLCQGSYNHLESFIYVYERQTGDIFTQLVLRDTLTLVINEIEEDLADLEEATISQHEIYSDEKIEEFLANMSDGPGKFTEGKNKNKNNKRNIK